MRAFAEQGPCSNAAGGLHPAEQAPLRTQRREVAQRIRPAVAGVYLKIMKGYKKWNRKSTK